MMKYYDGLKFSEFKEGINKLFQDLIENITKLKVYSKEYFETEIVRSFKVINDKSAKYIGQFTFSPNNGQRNLKVNFYQLQEIYKEVFLKKGVQFDDFCKIILLHELGHAIDFNNSKVDDIPLESFTNELSFALKNINYAQHNVLHEANRAILKINQYVKGNIYVKEKKANKIAGMLIKKLEKNNHSLHRAFKIFLAHHKQYLEFEDIPIIRGVIANRNVSSQVEELMQEYLGKRMNEKYSKILSRIHQEKGDKKENRVFLPLLGN